MDILALVVLAAVFAWREYTTSKMLREERSAHALQEMAGAEERRELLNRIKPETAQFIDPEEEVDLEAGEPAVTDEEYWAERGIDVSGNGGS